MSRSPAVVVALLLACAAYAAVAALTERIPLPVRAPSGRERRAAVAIRDRVPPLQQWGSRQFTWPYLVRHYEAAWYFTQPSSNACKAEFLGALDSALSRYPEVDLFLLAHHNDYLSWVAELPAARRHRLRLVYNSGCRDLRQGPAWIALGAAAYVGHRGVSASPVFYVYFLRRWARGLPLAEAVERSDRLMRMAFVRAEKLSGGRLDAAVTYRRSEAVLHGTGEVTIDGPR